MEQSLCFNRQPTVSSPGSLHIPFLELLFDREMIPIGKLDGLNVSGTLHQPSSIVVSETLL